MASRKNTSAASKGAPKAAVAASARAASPAPVSSTPVRNTPIPRPAAAAPALPAAPARREITPDQIARRAYEISQSGFGGSEDDNWFRAERELRGV